jgi:hypothetical protein
LAETGAGALGFLGCANAAIDKRMATSNNMDFFMRKIIVPRVNRTR